MKKNYLTENELVEKWNVFMITIIYKKNNETVKRKYKISI